MKTYARNTSLLAGAVKILAEEHPCTLRQLFYRAVSAGLMPNTPAEYKRLGALMTRGREEGIINRRWIVDHVRATMKPSSWSGLTDFSETVREAYRKDYWASLPHYVCVFVEKDAIAGTIQPVTHRNNVALHVVRGYCSVSFASEIADDWKQIEKPIFAYYLGDHDPSGYDLERDLREKLSRYSGRTIYDHNHYLAGGVTWKRLGVSPDDFDELNLIKLPVKKTDNRASGFVAKYGDYAAEVDAIPPSELRRRVEEAIDEHIDAETWNRLVDVEKAERETFRVFLQSLGKQIEPRSDLRSGPEAEVPQ